MTAIRNACALEWVLAPASAPSASLEYWEFTRLWKKFSVSYSCSFWGSSTVFLMRGDIQILFLKLCFMSFPQWPLCYGSSIHYLWTETAYGHISWFEVMTMDFLLPLFICWACLAVEKSFCMDGALHSYQCTKRYSLFIGCYRLLFYSWTTGNLFILLGFVYLYWKKNRLARQTQFLPPGRVRMPGMPEGLLSFRAVEWLTQRLWLRAYYVSGLC